MDVGPKGCGGGGPAAGGGQGGAAGPGGMLLPLSIKRQKKSGTLSQPSRNDSIISCSKVMHRHIMRKDAHVNSGKSNSNNRSSHDRDDEWDPHYYDIDNFIQQQHHVTFPTMGRGHGFAVFKQTPKRNQLPVPDEKKIYRFCKRVVETVHLTAECVIIALIYIERLMEIKSININARNWIPILIASLLTASKVWDDHSTFNGDLPAVVPIFTVQAINDLERRFLGDLNYEMHISSSDYARYYFGLRALRKKPVRSIPKFYLSIGLGGGRKVETKTLAKEGDLRGMPLSL